MTRRLVKETSLAGLRPTGVGGARVLESWDQITGYLRSLPDGDALADLFAEPVPQGGGKIMWFAGDGGPIIPFANLDPARQQAVRDSLGGLTARLDDETGKLESSSNPTARLIGETLRRAQQLPGAVEDSLFVIEGTNGAPDHPVLINWSTEPEGAPPPVEPLKEFVRKAPPPTPPTPMETVPPVAPVVAGPVAAPAVIAPVAASVALWPLLWLLALLLVGGIYYLLLLGCGVGSRGGVLDFCPAPVAAPAPPPDPLRADHERATTLLAELARLEQQLSQAPRCPAPPRPTQAQTPSPDPRENDFERRIAESRAQQGELTITLLWDTPSDLDLYVHCPDGDKIYFSKKESCGGRLDVDANANTGAIRSSPVENIFFTAGSAAHGAYQVEVRNQNHRGGEVDRFVVRIKKGDQIQIYEGRVDKNQKVRVAGVTMP